MKTGEDRPLLLMMMIPELTEMAPPCAYQLFPRRVPAAQAQMERLVPALWDRMFPGRPPGPDHRLGRIFGGMLRHPERSAQQICPYFFDQVAWWLPASSRRSALQPRGRAVPPPPPRRWRQSDPEAERRFDSWTDAGVYLSRLCRLQDPRTGGSLSEPTFLRLMYGYGG